MTLRTPNPTSAPTPKWMKAHDVAKLWNAGMPHQPPCKVDQRNSTVLANAYDSPGLDALAELFTWCHDQEWVNGLKRPMQAMAWLSKGHLGEVMQRKANESVKTISIGGRKIPVKPDAPVMNGFTQEEIDEAERNPIIF